MFGYVTLNVKYYILSQIFCKKIKRIGESCHFNRPLNVEIGVEYLMILFILLLLFYDYNCEKHLIQTIAKGNCGSWTVC